MTVDRRVTRTRKRLLESLLTLILEKGYDQVTVQDILDHADVGRTTFYAHYLNKADLLLGNMRADAFSLPPKEQGALLPSVMWLFEHAGDNLPLYRALSASDVIDIVYRNLNEGAQQNWIQFLEQEDITLALPTPAVATFLSSAMIGLLKWWLENNMPYSPSEMDKVFQEMASRGLFGRGLFGRGMDSEG